MQTKKIILAVSLFTALFAFQSCKKESISEEIETSFDLSNKQAINETLTEDVNNILNETVETEGLSGSREPLVCMGTTTCATVTVSGGAFPKTITLDFGTSGCSGTNSNIVRRGIVTIVLSDSIRRPGSTAVMNFTNYYVNNYKKEGTITWTNTSTSSTKSWTRRVENGKITAPDGRYWFHNSLKSITQVAGVNTPRVLIDDAFSITGAGEVTNSAGISRTSTILTALHKAVNCEHVDEGSIKFQGPNHYSTLDFGNGVCDAIATIAIDNYSPRTITLP